MNKWITGAVLFISLLLPFCFNACGSFRALPGDTSGAALESLSLDSYESANKYRETKIALQDKAMCAVLTDSSIKCRGENDQGQLGDGTVLSSSVPVSVLQATEGATFVGSFYRAGFFAVVKSKVITWGETRNTDFTHLQDAVDPVTVSAAGFVLQRDGGVMEPTTGHIIMHDVVQLASSQDLTCALTKSGQVICKGGQSGFSFPAVCPAFGGLDPDCTAPLAGFESVRAIGVGTSSACAVLRDGSIQCIGNNDMGQLGNGTNTDSGSPVRVLGLRGKAVDIAMSDYTTCALLESSDVQCWGANMTEFYPNANANIANTIEGLTNVASIALGEFGDVCAVLKDGAIKCFFTATSSALGPVPSVTSSSDVKALGNSYDHLCLLDEAGTLSCRGYYELDFKFSRPTVDIASFSDGGRGGCYVTQTGASECWSWNSVSKKVVFDPTRSRSSGVVFTTGGDSHGCTRLMTGETKCLYYSSVTPDLAGNPNELLPTNDPICFANIRTQSIDCAAVTATKKRAYPASLQIVAGEKVQIWQSGDGGCVLKLSGSLVCWGVNESGQLGNGTTTTSASPVTVPDLVDGVTDFAVGEHTEDDSNSVPIAKTHVCAVLKTRQMKCWGSNSVGQLGETIRSSANQPSPVVFPDSIGTLKISSTQYGGCRLGADRNVRCWGPSSADVTDRNILGFINPAPFE